MHLESINNVGDIFQVSAGGSGSCELTEEDIDTIETLTQLALETDMVIDGEVSDEVNTSSSHQNEGSSTFNIKSNLMHVTGVEKSQGNNNYENENRNGVRTIKDYFQASKIEGQINHEFWGIKREQFLRSQAGREKVFNDSVRAQCEAGMLWRRKEAHRIENLNNHVPNYGALGNIEEMQDFEKTLFWWGEMWWGCTPTWI